MKEFVEITCPMGMADDKMFTKIVNQGIDAHLEAFTKSYFEEMYTRDRLPRRVLNFHVTELPLLVRRLRGLDTDDTNRWADDIEALEEYPVV